MFQDSKALADSVIKMLEQPLADEGYDLLDVRIFRGGGRLTLRIYLDMENGIRIDQCTKAARSIDYLLEESDILPESSVVEVSSPGVKRPLRTDRHLNSALGQQIVVKMVSRKNVKGILNSFSDDEIVLQQDGKEENPSFSRLEIDSINLNPEFDAQFFINADRRKRKEEKRKVRQERRSRQDSK
ncbi:ribosome maturation factor RimP [bacterium]|jgi:ribosome maturation factor RimP|nr:ribosome maturation factor RimP [bacterium]MBT4291135.1 ribosome maturation factor RimP [bacterium]MBT7311571.1 ribosome maturation factor RimP [bacterium]